MASGSPERDWRERLFLPVIYLTLFVSGGAALVYQTCWGRMLHRVFGVSDQAVATVLAAFFLGLGAGAMLGGWLVRRFVRPARIYAVLEAAIGIFGLLSLLLIPRVHDLYAGLMAGASAGSSTWVRFALSLAILLPPTLLMGATLPVLVALVARREGWTAPATRLYATHTFGAMTGAGLSGLVLIAEFGTRITVASAAIATLFAAAAVWKLAPGNENENEHEHEHEHENENDNENERENERPRIRLAVLVAAMTGMAALASEVLWTRVLRIIVMGTTQAFAAMLVNYLAGIALGSLLAARWLGRGRDAARLLAGTQTLLGALTVVAMYVAARVPRFLPMITEDASATPFWLGDILLVSCLVLFPIALLMGTSIPLCWRLADGGRPGKARAARRAGAVLGANTLGGLVGSLSAGFGAVPAMGLEAALLCVMGLHLLVASVVGPHAVGRSIVRRTLAFAGPLMLGAVLLSAEPSLHLYFLINAHAEPKRAVLDGPGPGWRDATLFLEEGRTTTVTVKARRQGRLELRNDGRLESVLYDWGSGMGPEMALLGGLPNLFAEPREEALVIGLGAGHVAKVLRAGPWKRIRVVELEEAVVRAARFMHEQRDRPPPLDDPRVELTIDDGRAQLVMAPTGSLDAVVSQPSHPWLPGSSALYTEEFFVEVERVLRPGGVFSLWMSTYRIQPKHLRMAMGTLQRVFPHVRAFVVDRTSLVLCASPSPMPFNARVRTRFEDEVDLAPFFAPHQMGTFAELVAAHELSDAGFPTVVGDAPVLVDDRPLLEFDLAALGSMAHVTYHQLDSLFWYVPWMTPEELTELPADTRVAALLARLERVETRPLGVERVEKAVATLSLDRVGRAQVNGALAEMRGELEVALAHYDAAEHPTAASRADRLRLHARQYRQLVARSRARRVAPADPRPLLSAALATRDPDDLDHALSAAESTPAARSIAFATARAFRDHGCDGVRSLPAPPFAVTHDLNAIDVAEDCARRAGDVVHADYLAQQRLRVRLGIAEALITRGIDQVRVEQDDYAVMLLRLGLGYQPSHAHAASVLAHKLVERNERDQATRYLRNAYRLAMAIPEDAAELEMTAANLGIELPTIPNNGAP